MRGKVLHARIRRISDGITPACAGKRFGIGERIVYKRDHPRVCGEKEMIIELVKKDEGSPPRVRGKAPLCDSVECRDGITPACAGKSQTEK